MPGAESLPGSWQGWILPSGQGPSGIEEFSRNFYAFFLRGDPRFSILELRMQDVTAGHAKFGALLDAANPDLTPFAAHGGKLIHYHGANDPASVGYSTDYFRKVQSRMGETEASIAYSSCRACSTAGVARRQARWIGSARSRRGPSTACRRITCWRSGPLETSQPAGLDREATSVAVSGAVSGCLSESRSVRHRVPAGGPAVRRSASCRSRRVGR